MIYLTKTVRIKYRATPTQGMMHTVMLIWHDTSHQYHYTCLVAQKYWHLIIFYLFLIIQTYINLKTTFVVPVNKKQVQRQSRINVFIPNVEITQYTSLLTILL